MKKQNWCRQWYIAGESRFFCVSTSMRRQSRDMSTYQFLHAMFSNRRNIRLRRIRCRKCTIPVVRIGVVVVAVCEAKAKRHQKLQGAVSWKCYACRLKKRQATGVLQGVKLTRTAHGSTSELSTSDCINNAFVPCMHAVRRPRVSCVSIRHVGAILQTAWAAARCE